MRTLIRAAALAAIAAVALSHNGCGGGEARYRAIDPELKAFLDWSIDNYEGPEAKQLFAGTKISTRTQRNGFTGGLKKKYHAKFGHDPRLDIVAKAYAHAYHEAESFPASNLVDWMMWKLGITGRRVDVMGWWAKYDGSQKRLTQALGRHAKKFKDKGERFEYGIGRLKVGPMEYFQGLVIVEKGVIIDELPKHFAPGEEILLRGKVNGEHEIASVTMTLGEVDTLSMPIDTNDDGKFLLKLPAPRKPGRHFLEIEVWREPTSWTTDLLVPIYVNAEEPTEPDKAIVDPAPNPANKEDWPQTLLALYNAERAKHNLPPLRIHSKVQSLAQEYADKLADRWYRPFPDLGRLLFKNGIKTSRTSGGVSIFEYLAEYFWDSINSPDVRARILDDRFTKVGFGFTRDPDSEADRYIATRFMFADGESRIDIPDEVKSYFAKPAATYDAPESGEPYAGVAELNPGLADQLHAALADGLSTPISHAPELDVLALYYARRGRVDSRLHHWMTWKLGLTGTETYYRRRISNEEGISPYIVLELQNLLEWSEKDRERSYRFGVTRVPRGDGTYVETTVVMARDLTIEPLKKRFDPGEEILIEGRFLVEAKHPHFYMSTDGVETIQMPIETDDQGHFAIKTVAPKTPGRYLVEITIEPIEVEDKKLVFRFYTAMLVPIFVGKDERSGFPRIVLDPPENPEELDTWPDRILAVYNAERAEHGLDPLRRNRLADALVADRLEQELQDFDPPGFETMAEHLAESHGGFAWAASQSLIDSVEEQAWRNLLVPSHRRLILDEKVTMIGLGLALEGYYYMEMLVSDQPDEDHPGTKFIKAAEDLKKSKRIPAVGSLSETSVREEISTQLEEIEECYDDVLEYYEDFAGRITIDYVIGVKGKVIAASLDSSTLDHYAAETCIVDAVRDWEFPAPLGEGVVFQKQTLELKPGRKKGIIKIIFDN